MMVLHPTAGVVGDGGGDELAELGQNCRSFGGGERLGEWVRGRQRGEEQGVRWREGLAGWGADGDWAGSGE